jgi:DNA primase
MIPEPDIERLKSSLDFMSIIEGYGLKPIQKGKNIFIKCPFHEDDTASLSIDPVKNLYHCFGCGEKGNPIQFLQKMEAISFREAYDKLNNSDSLKLKATTSKDSKTITNNKHRIDDETIPQIEIDKLFVDTWSHFKESFANSPEAKEYLHKIRGIKNHQGLEVGYCSGDFAKNLAAKEKKKLQVLGLLLDKESPHFKDCIVFALKDKDQKVVSFYGRKITKDKGSHYYLKNRKGLFYSYKNKDSLILVESIVDGLSLLSSDMGKGIGDVLSLYGVNGYSDEHKEVVNNYQKIYICLDGDKQGLEAAHNLAHKLRQQNKKVYIVELPNEGDLNDYFLLAAKNKNEPNEKLTWLKNELTHLEEKKLQLKEINGNHHIEGEKVNYHIQGLLNQSLDKLRLTFKVSFKNNESLYFIDTVDLYSRRARQSFIEGLKEELNLSESLISTELKEMIPLLEKEKLADLNTDENQIVELSNEEKESAIKALKDPNLIDNLLKDFEVSMIGEEKAKLVGYLGTVSRLLEEPLGVLIVSRSGAGKTMLQDSICSFVPDESLEKYTRLTGQSLFYQAEDGLKHKVLAIEEEGGMQEAMYAIRTLQSSQRLTLVTTRNDPKSGKFKSEKYTVEGPVFILISTTNPEALDYETRNRFIILTINESEDQTKKIMEARKKAYTLEGQLESKDIEEVLKKCTNMQRLLKPMKVINNYAPHLMYPFDRLQMRREFKKYMNLINSIALLHQHQREIKSFSKEGKVTEYIEVKLEDIALANKLVLEFFPNSIDELAPHTRRLGEEISKLAEKKGGDVKFTRRELRDHSNWSDWQVREGLRQLEELEYVIRLSGKNGAVITYEMLVDVNTDTRQKLLLTEIEELEKEFGQREAS